ncbi:AAA family ATPase [Pseudomonas putida]|uniref:AAA family ATPase n=2 Tax=Pseudomonas putida group TaxID=136845 RepID=A0A7W2QLP0_PSEPU|nr:ATP-binding protein [Pseudomonas putida]MBA6119096.1 AAA family ATPase [Pseudomonas putida]
MIKALSLRNFMRVHEKVEIELGRVTILVGANGSGKSSILKGIHWTIRCATLQQDGKVTLEQMDYVPSKDYVHLAHKTRITNGSNTPKILAEFIDDNDIITSISLGSARNDAGVTVAIKGPLADSLTDKERHTTSYIPGLAGLAETETLLATPILHRKAASGEGGSVLRHMMLDLRKEEDNVTDGHSELAELGKWVSKVIPGARFWIKFDSLRDTTIYAKFWTPDMKTSGRTITNQWKPLEMAGTGFLQIVQIFAYLLKFKSTLLLIDEPDAHLHPGTQELLIKTLEEAVTEFPQTKIIISTHSPSLVRASSASTRIHWMDKGTVKDQSEDTVKMRMGWGALDKDLILFTEDDNTQMLKNIIKHWPDLERKILLWPTFGKSSLPHGDALRKLRDRMKVSILVHRDRDFMSDVDVALWRDSKGYLSNNIELWATEGSDIESAFCSSAHICALFDISAEEAQELVSNAVLSLDPEKMTASFSNAITDAVKGLGEGKSNPIARYQQLGGHGIDTLKGKILLPAIADAITLRFRGTERARKLALLKRLSEPTTGCELFSTLKTSIIAALEAGQDHTTPSAEPN